MQNFIQALVSTPCQWPRFICGHRGFLYIYFKKSYIYICSCVDSRFIDMRRVYKCAFVYDLSWTVLWWPCNVKIQLRSSVKIFHRRKEGYIWVASTLTVHTPNWRCAFRSRIQRGACGWGVHTGGPLHPSWHRRAQGDRQRWVLQKGSADSSGVECQAHGQKLRGSIPVRNVLLQGQS